MENKKIYVPVHGANEVKDLKDLADQVSFYKQELLTAKMYDWERDHMVKNHTRSIEYKRDQMIKDLFGSGTMLDLMKIGITYADLLLATEEIWAELEEAREKYRATLEAAKVDQGEPQEVAE